MNFYFFDYFLLITFFLSGLVQRHLILRFRFICMQTTRKTDEAADAGEPTICQGEGRGEAGQRGKEETHEGTQNVILFL